MTDIIQGKAREVRLSYAKLVGERVSTERKRRGWSREDLASRAKMTLKTVANVETGRHFPQVDTLAKIAVAFDWSPEDLLGGPKKAKRTFPKRAA